MGLLRRLAAPSVQMAAAAAAGQVDAYRATFVPFGRVLRPSDRRLLPVVRPRFDGEVARLRVLAVISVAFVGV